MMLSEVIKNFQETFEVGGDIEVAFWDQDYMTLYSVTPKFFKIEEVSWITRPSPTDPDAVVEVDIPPTKMLVISL